MSLADRIADTMPLHLAFAIKLTKSEYDAQDLLQQSTLKALKSMHTFKKDAYLKTWLCQIVYSVFIDEWRKQSKFKKTVSIDEYLELPNNDYENIESSLEAQRIQNVLDSSKLTKIEFLRLRAIGYKYDEIAEIHNAPLGTVKSYVSRLRKELKKEI